MRTTILTLVALVSLGFAGAALGADTAQTACPVSGEPVDTAEYVDWQGQRVYFCCPKCAAGFKQEPDKYFEKMAAAGVVPESVQTHDPVCNMTQERSGIHADHRGRRVYFCSAYCKGAFEKDPVKYLDKLPGEQPKAGS